MELTKPIYEIHQKMKEAGSEIYRKAMTGEQCANLFAKLNRSDPDMHELVRTAISLQPGMTDIL